MRITASGCLVDERAQRPERALLVAIAAVSVLGASVISNAQRSLSASMSATPGGVFAANPTLAKPSYGTLPMSYEPNVGQVAGAARFIAHGTTETALLEPGRVVITPSSGGSPVVMQLVGGAAQPAIRGTDALPGTVNYIVGRDRAQWRTGIPTYAQVTYANAYPGVDMVWRGTTSTPEYDFVVAAGANPSVIKVHFSGARTVRVDAATGDLVVMMPKGTMRQRAPKIYQPIASGNEAVSGHFVITGGDEVGFALGPYNRSRPLVIDPTFTYSTFLGGSGQDSGYAITVDAGGNAYVAGATCSTNFPTLNAVQSTYPGPAGSACSEFIDSSRTVGSAFVSKLNPQGTALVYSTYLGGSSYTGAFGLAIDTSGDAYVAGITQAADFPTTAGAFQALCGSAAASASRSVAFATELAASGSALAYSTCLGGSNTPSDPGRAFTSGLAIQVHSGRMYVGGYTSADDAPVTTGALQTANAGGEDAYITEINPAGGGAADLVYSTYLGGSGNEAPYGENGGGGGLGLAVDGSGVIYIAGATESTDFPVTPGAYQTALAGPSDPTRQDAFVSKIDPAAATGHQLLYSTYVGGKAAPYAVAGSALGLDAATGVVLGPPIPGSTMPTIYVGGVTSSADFPTTSGAVEAPPLFCADFTCLGFLSRLNPAGGGQSDLVYSSYIGADGAANSLQGVAVDPATGNAVVAGWTLGSNLPTKDPIQPMCGCFTSSNTFAPDAWVAEIRPDPAGSAASNLVFSTFLGGTGFDAAHAVAVDSAGGIYITGEAEGTGPVGRKQRPILFPTSPGAFQSTFAGGTAIRDPDAAGGTFGGAADAFVTKIAFADLSVSAAAPGTANARQPLTYTVTAANAGPSPVSAVVGDTLPKGVAFVSASPGCSVGTGSPRVVTCALGVMDPGTSASLTIVTKPGAAGTVSNTITIDGDAADLTPADNSATATTTVT